jgi:hypothetical protein
VGGVRVRASAPEDATLAAEHAIKLMWSSSSASQVIAWDVAVWEAAHTTVPAVPNAVWLPVVQSAPVIGGTTAAPELVFQHSQSVLVAMLLIVTAEPGPIRVVSEAAKAERVQRDRCIHIVWVGGVWCLWQRPIIDNRDTARSGAKKERERETRREKVRKKRG